LFAAVRFCDVNISPFAVFLPINFPPYHEAIPVMVSPYLLKGAVAQLTVTSAIRKIIKSFTFIMLSKILFTGN